MQTIGTSCHVFYIYNRFFAPCSLLTPTDVQLLAL